MRLIGSMFPAHTVFFATHDHDTNVIHRVRDQARLNVPEGHTEAFHHSLCRLALAESTQSIRIPALADHPLAKNHSFTQMHGNGSFLGTIIALDDNTSIGSLCLISDQPYEFTERDEKWMQGMAFMVGQTVQMEQEKVRDPLTGLYDQRSFPLLFEHLMNEYAICSFFYIDVQNLQMINQQYGWEQGDSLLQKIAHFLSEELPQEAIIGRVSQDEFAVLLPHPEDENEEYSSTKAVEQMLYHLWNSPFSLNGNDVYVHVRIGLAYFPKEAATYEELLETAKRRLMQAKQTKDYRYIIDNDNQADLAQQEFMLSNELQKEELYEQLSLHYQPQVDLQDGEIGGVEALLRWDHPVYGSIPPNVWLPIAENSSVLPVIGKWVLEKSCSEMSDYFSQKRPIDLSVNVSPLQLYEPAFSGNVHDILTKKGLPPSRLILEITERLFIDENPEVLKNLEELRAMGVRIAIDDFGVGYASFHLLHRFPINVLKIDKKLSTNLTSTANKKIVSAIIELAYSLNMRSVVEGIETYEQHSFYQARHVKWGQGYYYYKPLPFQELLNEKTDA